MDIATLIYQARLDAYLRFAETYAQLEAHWSEMTKDPHHQSVHEACTIGLALVRSCERSLRRATFVLPGDVIERLPSFDFTSARNDDPAEHAVAVLATLMDAAERAFPLALDRLRGFLGLD